MVAGCRLLGLLPVGQAQRSDLLAGDSRSAEDSQQVLQPRLVVLGVGHRDQPSNQCCDREVLDVFETDTELAGELSQLGGEVLVVAVEERVLDVGEHIAVADEPIDTLSGLDRIDDLVEEGRLAADDVDGRVPQGLSDDLGLGLRDVLLCVDRGDLDVLVLVEFLLLCS